MNPDENITLEPQVEPDQAVPAPQAPAPQPPVPQAPARPTKFCPHCGKTIDAEAVICPLCGCQVKETGSAGASPNIVINNSNTSTNTNTQIAGGYGMMRERNKWVALLLCFFLGVLGVHKFYEGKTGMGVLYLLTFGCLGIGVLADFITLLFKPNPYYVRAK